MKRYILLMITTALLLSSCEGFLDREPVDFFVPEPAAFSQALRRFPGEWGSPPANA